MNLTTSLLPLASQNLSSIPLQDTFGYSYCHEFYGKFPKSGDCVSAVGLLEKGASEVEFSVHSGHAPHSLPLSKSYGESPCRAFRALPNVLICFQVNVWSKST